MYPSSTSSSSQTPVGSTGLTRYVSAPGSLLTTAVDEVVGAEREFAAIGSRSIRGQYFTGDSSSITPESTCEVKPSYNSSNTPYRGLQRSYRFDETNFRDFTSASQLKNIGVVNGVGETFSSSSSSALLRQRSSPAGFLSHLNVNAHKNGASDNGFSVSRVAGSYHSSQGGDDSAHRVSRLKSQLSFSGQDSSSSSQASKISRNVDGITSDNSHLSYGTTSCFAMDDWDHSNSIVFSAPPNKRAKNYDGEIFFSTLESQFSLPQTSLEMETVERLLHIPEDSVPCKIRAKRGCATHPRSIAERERRTRISGKLKKLQDLVPNMDKQTSYADMLDLAVQHIKGLQGQVQKMQKEMENCKCG